MTAKRRKKTQAKPQAPLAEHPRVSTHVQLVHGFLVKPGARQPARAETPNTGAVRPATVVVQASPPDTVTREGAAPDATLH